MTQKKVLLVDDSNTIIMMERMILGKGPYAIVTAVNGQDAVAKAKAEKPDLILMDVMMPEMNGFEACRRIRSESATAKIPIIMVTTRGEDENVDTGFAAGCNDYVTKPIDAAVLLSKLRTYLGT